VFSKPQFGTGLQSGSQIETDTETKSRGPASNRSPCRCYSPRESKPNHPLQGTRRTRIVSRSRRTEDRSGNFKYLWLDSCLLNPRQNQFNKDVTSAVTSSKALILRGFQGAAAPWLGYSFASAGAPKKRIAPKAVDRFKERIRELTSRNRGVRIERMAEELFLYLRGWIGYFGRWWNFPLSKGKNAKTIDGCRSLIHTEEALRRYAPI